MILFTDESRKLEVNSYVYGAHKHELSFSGHLFRRSSSKQELIKGHVYLSSDSLEMTITSVYLVIDFFSSCDYIVLESLMNAVWPQHLM